MKIDRLIKSKWAAVHIAPDSRVVVAAQPNGSPRCWCFEDLAELSEAIHTKKLSVQTWIMTVPTGLGLHKTLTLPAPTLSEAAQMIEFELPNLIPVDPSQIVYGCHLIESQDHRQTIQVSLIKRDKLDTALAPLRENRIEPEWILLDALCWHHSLVQVISPEDSHLAILLDRDQALITTHRGALRNCEGLSKGTQSTRQWLDRLCDRIGIKFQELNLSANGPVHWTVAGDPQECGRLEERLTQDRIAESACQVTYEAPNDPAIDHELAMSHILALGALQAVQCQSDPYGNLLPQETLKQLKQKQQVRQWALRGAMVVILLLQVLGIMIAANSRLERQCRAIETSLQPVEQVAQEIDSKRRQINDLLKQYQGRGMITGIFEDLFSHTPASVTLSQMSLNVPRTGMPQLTLRGQAGSTTAAADFPSALGESVYLKAMTVERTGHIDRIGQAGIAEFLAGCSIDPHATLKRRTP